MNKELTIYFNKNDKIIDVIFEDFDGDEIEITEEIKEEIIKFFNNKTK